MNAMTIEFAHKGQGWVATVDGIDEATGIGTLTVKPDNYDDDPCAGQNVARSAFFEACTLLELDPADAVEIHSGGCYSRKVMPESGSPKDGE